VLLRPPAAHSAIGKISISEPPTPLRNRSYQIARLVLALSVSSGRFVIGRRSIGNKGEVSEQSERRSRDFANFGADLTIASVESRQLILKGASPLTREDIKR